jgi:hypothetical protein
MRRVAFQENPETTNSSAKRSEAFTIKKIRKNHPSKGGFPDPLLGLSLILGGDNPW